MLFPVLNIFPRTEKEKKRKSKTSPEQLAIRVPDPPSPSLSSFSTPPSSIHVPFLLSSLSTPRAIQSAIAMTVIMGLTPLAEGNTLASATYRPPTPQTRPRGSTTPSAARALIRLVPIWCAQLKPVDGGRLSAFSRIRSHAAKSASLTPWSIFSSSSSFSSS